MFVRVKSVETIKCKKISIDIHTCFYWPPPSLQYTSKHHVMHHVMSAGRGSSRGGDKPTCGQRSVEGVTLTKRDTDWLKLKIKKKKNKPDCGKTGVNHWWLQTNPKHYLFLRPQNGVGGVVATQTKYLGKSRNLGRTQNGLKLKKGLKLKNFRGFCPFRGPQHPFFIFWARGIAPCLPRRAPLLLTTQCPKFSS